MQIYSNYLWYLWHIAVCPPCMPNVMVHIDNNRASLALEGPFFVPRCHTSIHYGSHASEKCPQKSLLWHHSHPQGLLTWGGLWVATWPAIHETQWVIFDEIKMKKCEFERWNRCGIAGAWLGLRKLSTNSVENLQKKRCSFTLRFFLCIKM